MYQPLFLFSNNILYLQMLMNKLMLLNTKLFFEFQLKKTYEL